MESEEKRRTWSKLHLAVVDIHEVIRAEVSLVNVGDSEALGPRARYAYSKQQVDSMFST